MSAYRDNYSWNFNIGDLVFHLEYGSGIVENRTIVSFHEMARPIRIVEREMYRVMFPDPHCIKSISHENLKIIQRETVF